MTGWEWKAARRAGHDIGRDQVLWAEGEIAQAAVFGEHLKLVRRIECDADAQEIRLIDRVRNFGFDSQPHMYLYHINFGWPLVDEGTRFVAPVLETTWQSDSVESQGVSHTVMPGPQPAFVEQVYEHTLGADLRTSSSGSTSRHDLRDARRRSRALGHRGVLEHQCLSGKAPTQSESSRAPMP